jgi:hypothetical protein
LIDIRKKENLNYAILLVIGIIPVGIIGLLFKHQIEGFFSSMFYLGIFFPESQLNILPYHRVTTDLNGLTPEQFLAALSNDFTVDSISAADAQPPARAKPEAAPRSPRSSGRTTLRAIRAVPSAAAAHALAAVATT